MNYMYNVEYPNHLTTIINLKTVVSAPCEPWITHTRSEFNYVYNTKIYIYS